MAEVALHVGNTAHGDEFASESIGIFEHLNHRPFVARTRVIQGQLECAKNNLDADLELQKKAFFESVEIGDNQALAAIAATLSRGGKHARQISS